ncbi:MAG: hypothetical protein IPK79_03205 [Vampirovibrionales bacterium]|nr:hypothetical protein [Vampirovibrionales bacterium]
MTLVPQFILKRMYVNGSLRATADGVSFDLKNALGPGHMTRFSQIRLNDVVFEPSQFQIRLGDRVIAAVDITEETPLAVGMGAVARCEIPGATLTPGRHEIQVSVVVREAGAVSLKVEDDLIV